jgi:hypothetical protein
MHKRPFSNLSNIHRIVLKHGKVQTPSSRGPNPTTPMGYKGNTNIKRNLEDSKDSVGVGRLQ